MKNQIPVIDIFAGPGGLSEGFARFQEFRSSELGYDVNLSIEKDPVACETLRVRSFFRQFSPGQVPEAYYKYIRGEAGVDALAAYDEWQHALAHVWTTELGKMPESVLHQRIAETLDGAENWVLIGGPPCQAFSLVGRSRMTGMGHLARDQKLSSEELDELRLKRLSTFYDDSRHTLYREYLRIVAVHQPAAFVMENVKGILSSRLKLEGENSAEPSERVFPRIRDDLSNPWDALANDPLHDELEEYRQGPARKYRLFSFVHDAFDDSLCPADRDFLIRCEDYGIPQKRHRVIILGVRDDIDIVPGALSKRAYTTVNSVLGNLPRLRSGLSRETDNPEAWQGAIREFFSNSLLAKLQDHRVKDLVSCIVGRRNVGLMRGGEWVECATPKVTGSDDLNRWLVDDRVGGVIQHHSRTHMKSDLGRYLFAAAATAVHQKGQTPKLDQWPEELLPHHRNVSMNPTNNRPVAHGFADRFRVQSGEDASSTITSHIAKDGHYYIHPDPEQCRSLTVREAARLQTFPDNYFFCGNRTQQYHQVGNAVPPYLAVQLAEVVANLLKGRLEETLSTTGSEAA